jgi:hypothetical protein
MITNALHNLKLATVEPIFGTMPAMFGGFAGHDLAGLTVDTAAPAANLADAHENAAKPVAGYAYITPVGVPAGLNITGKPNHGFGETGQEGARTQ